MYRLVLCACLVAVWPRIGIAQAGEVVYSLDGNILVWNAATGESEVLFKMPEHPIEPAQYPPELSGDGTLVSALVAVFDSPGHFKNVLVVYDRHGKKRLSLENVFRCAWSPKGEKLVYLTGEPIFTRGGFASNGAWIHDFKDESVKRIADAGDEVYWASFDNRIYLREGRIKAYDPATDQTVDTDYKDLFFSPDGKFYYFIDSYDTASLNLFLREGNRNITNEYLSTEESNSVFAVRWLDSRYLWIQGSHFRGDGKPDFMLLSLEDRTIRSLPDQIVAYFRERREVLLKGALSPIPIEKLPVREKRPGSSNEKPQDVK